MYERGITDIFSERVLLFRESYYLLKRGYFSSRRCFELEWEVVKILLSDNGFSSVRPEVARGFHNIFFSLSSPLFFNDVTLSQCAAKRSQCFPVVTYGEHPFYRVFETLAGGTQNILDTCPGDINISGDTGARESRGSVYTLKYQADEDIKFTKLVDMSKLLSNLY